MTPQFAFLFPGQGSQSIGMLDQLAASHREIQQTFAEAGDVLQQDLWQLVTEGPAEDLNLTRNTQPAMLAAGVAVWRVWQAAGGPPPAYAAGHSLGEYTALVCAGVLQFADALTLVARRADLMQQAVPAGEGGMAAVLGLDDDSVRRACTEAAAGEVLEAVNFNAPGQVVVAGQASAITRLAEVAKALGAKRIMPLPVSIPSHCSLMRPAAEQLATYLEQVDLQPPALPVFQNVHADSSDDPERIRTALQEQLYSPVRWVETVQNMARAGAKVMLECGPGKVLTGLNKRIDRALETVALVDDSSFDNALARLGTTPSESTT